MLAGDFVLWKALGLLPLLPVLIPVFVIGQLLSAINGAHLTLVGYMHGTETFYWAIRFFGGLLLLPFIPVLWACWPVIAIAGLLFKVGMGFFIFFTFPISYLVALWHAFSKLHMHFVGTFLCGLKLLNL